MIFLLQNSKRRY